MRSIGVTEKEISNIRAIMLGEEPEVRKWAVEAMALSSGSICPKMFMQLSVL